MIKVTLLDGAARTQNTPQVESFSITRPSRRIRWMAFLAALGPGIVVMLADTDVGSILTAAQSGVQWGYKLLILQIILIPILYLVQELTVRLGVFTGKGHGELVRDTFGATWAWISVGGLAIAVIGAIVTEFAGLAGVGELFGIPRWITLILAAAFLLAVVWTGSYRRVERIAILLGLFELAFVFVAFAARPDVNAIAESLLRVPLGNASYLYLALANIGAVIMPWMIFYQQSAVVDKKLRADQYRGAQWDTAIGAIVTQMIMMAVIIATAATIGQKNPNGSLNSIGQVVNALVPFLGS